jgi:hypothetical protein
MRGWYANERDFLTRLSVGCYALHGTWRHVRQLIQTGVGNGPVTPSNRQMLVIII